MGSRRSGAIPHGNFGPQPTYRPLPMRHGAMPQPGMSPGVKPGFNPGPTQVQPQFDQEIMRQKMQAMPQQSAVPAQLIMQAAPVAAPVAAPTQAAPMQAAPVQNQMGPSASSSARITADMTAALAGPAEEQRRSRLAEKLLETQRH